MKRIALALLCALAAWPAAAGDDAWIEVTSPNFRVVSEAGEKSARRMAWQFEQVHSVIHRMWPWAKTDPGRPFVVLAVHDESAMKDLAPRYWEVKGGVRPVGVFVSGGGADFVAIRTDQRDPGRRDVNPYSTAYAGYVHIVLGYASPRPLPVWLLRGLTEVFGNTVVHSDFVDIGRLIPWHLERMRGGARLHLPDLLAVDRQSPYYTKDADRQVFDAEAWLFVHYLVFGEKGALRPRLDAVMSRLLSGQDPAQAQAALGSLGELESGFNTYITRELYGYGRMDLDVNVDSKSFGTRALAPAESDALRAKFHVAMERKAEARGLIARSREAAPEAPYSYEAEGLLLDRQENDHAARDAYAEAVRLKSEDFHTLYRYAMLAWSDDADAQTLDRIVSSLERAVRVGPDVAYAHDFQALALMRVDDSAKGAERALGSARRAVELDPRASSYRRNLARALWQTGAHDEARDQATQARSLARNAREAQSAQDLLGYFARLEATPAGPAASSSGRLGSRRAVVIEDSGECASGDAAVCQKYLASLEKACGGDDAYSCLILAATLEHGLGVEADPVRAVGFYERACALDDYDTCTYVANMEAYGRGVPKDTAKAEKLARKGCDGGSSDGCVQLAVLYAAHAARADRARAREMLKHECDAGNPQGCSLLKSMPR